MKSSFLSIDNKFQKLVLSDYLSFKEVSAKRDVMGVYAIYDENDVLIYVGNTNKFHIRFGTDLKYESTHTLMRKLLKSGIFQDRIEAVEFLINRCKIKVEICNTKREAEALEAMTIYILNPMFNK